MRFCIQTVGLITFEFGLNSKCDLVYSCVWPSALITRWHFFAWHRWKTNWKERTHLMCSNSSIWSDISCMCFDAWLTCIFILVECGPNTQGTNKAKEEPVVKSQTCGAGETPKCAHANPLNIIWGERWGLSHWHNRVSGLLKEERY